MTTAMPTNLFNRKVTANSAKGQAGPNTDRHTQAQERIVSISVGRKTIRVRLANSATAERLWLALPLFSAAELWGESIHFEIPVRTARDRTARINATPGEIYFWPSDERIIIPFGPTPISRPGEIRLPEPCNVIATAIDDVTQLKSITPAEKVSINVEKNSYKEKFHVRNHH